MSTSFRDRRTPKQWAFNHEIETVEIVLDNDEVVTISKDNFVNIIKTLPEFNEEYQIRELLKQLWDIRAKKSMTYGAIYTEVQGLRSQHKTIREKLDKAENKLEVFRLSAMTKDLSAEKVVLAELRMQVKLLALEEVNLKGQLAKIIVGKGSQ